MRVPEWDSLCCLVEKEREREGGKMPLERE
jgi:hypothetical protein